MKVNNLRSIVNQIFAHQSISHVVILGIGETLPHTAFQGVSQGFRRALQRLLSESFINVAMIERGLELRLEGRLDLLLQDHVPVNTSEPRVAHKLLAITRSTAEASIRFSYE